MNIKNRIVKLEKTVEPSGFCGCKGVSWLEMYCQDLTEEVDNTLPILKGEPVPEECSRCRRPINKQVFILRLVDDTTKDRFPNEWREQ